MLSRFALAPENVRKTPPDPQADAELKASIAALGLLENLVVRSDSSDADRAERHAVVAGGRRLKAMQALTGDRVLDANLPVPCLVTPVRGELGVVEEVKLVGDGGEVGAALFLADLGLAHDRDVGEAAGEGLLRPLLAPLRLRPSCQRRLKIRPKGGAKDCHLGWWAELGVRLGFGDAVRGFFGGSGQRSHAELKRSAPTGRPQGGMVCRVGVSLATRALPSAT